jgi:Tol biopolymer transport system component
LCRWRLDDISSYKEPHIVLKNLPICGNCHSFSRDGKTFGMDMDYKKDKGAYVLTPVRKKILLSKDDFISWNELRISEKIPNMGLFSKISPDGKYVISTINEKPFMFVIDDLYFSQLFFPITGVLAYYSREEKKFYTLPGADDPNYIQTSPAWNPDGKYIVFSKAKTNKRLIEVMGDKRVLIIEPDVRIDELNEQYQIHYDLYRIPFNRGRGGRPEPLMGASNNGMSNYFPRFSPDGKWIVFNRSETGLVAQPSSQLYIIPAEGGVARKMRCNTDLYNSWHSWSPNGRWMVFSSKVNTPYTEIFITHIDENGNDSPPLLLSRFSSKDYASIMPEFVNIKPDAIKEIKLMDSR